MNTAWNQSHNSVYRTRRRFFAEHSVDLTSVPQPPKRSPEDMLAGLVELARETNRRLGHDEIGFDYARSLADFVAGPGSGPRGTYPGDGSRFDRLRELFSSDLPASSDRAGDTDTAEIIRQGNNTRRPKLQGALVHSLCR